MTDKDKIRKEIENRMYAYNQEADIASAEDAINEKIFDAKYKFCKEILSFIDSLPEEPVSEDLEEAARRYVTPPCALGIKTFKAGAKWQKEKMLKDAIEREVHEDGGGYPYIDATEFYDYDKDIPLAKEGDKIKVIMVKED